MNGNMHNSSFLKSLTMKKLSLLTIVFLVFAFSGCKKNTDGIEATHMKLMDKIGKLGIPEKMKNSSNSNAQQAVGYYDQVTGIEDYFDWFNLPDDATRDGNNYYWSSGGLSLWEVYSETGSNYVWDIYIKTNDTSKLKYFHSEESKDGNTGRMDVYNYLAETNDLLYSYDWSFDASGNLTMNEIYGDGSLKYEIISNVDLSGSSEMYTNGKLYYRFQWNSDGSGSCQLFDDNGNVSYTESWTVADL
jgi:hypothetical protein